MRITVRRVTKFLITLIAVGLILSFVGLPVLDLVSDNEIGVDNQKNSVIINIDLLSHHRPSANSKSSFALIRDIVTEQFIESQITTAGYSTDSVTKNLSVVVDYLNRQQTPVTIGLKELRASEEKLVPVNASSQGYAAVISSYRDMIQQMENRWEFWWIRQRLQRVWPEFEAAGRALTDDCRKMTGKNIKRVMILPGVLTLTNFAKPDLIKRGGPLGELMQWADLIAGCLALCHKVAMRLHVQSTGIELRTEMDERATNVTGCDVNNYADVIYTDIGAYRTLPPDVVDAYRYKFRVLDAFGTEPAYNDPEYAQAHGTAINRWGMLGLNTKQFYTLYPHTPDNSFLGFTVSSSKLANGSNLLKDNYALIIGKDSKYLRAKRPMLDVIQKRIPLMATMPVQASDLLPLGSNVIGVLDSSSYQNIANKAKICVGLGDPIESPSVMEILARGCVFLNPRRKGQTRFLTGKPTSRIISSQVPYVEQYIGPPNAYAIDDDNLEELDSILRSILEDKQITPIIPVEFTVNGYLQRLNTYLIHQDFCLSNLNPGMPNPDWPPAAALKPIVAELNTSCIDACQNNGLVCEHDFFPEVDDDYFMPTLGLLCIETEARAEIWAPAFMESSKTCVIQLKRTLYSCAGVGLADSNRICPCRKYIRHQVALCEEC